MRLIFLFIVVVHMTTTCEAQDKRFPNARFLGMGYNVLKGNPDNNLHDPGFTFPVLKFTWTTNSKTSDNKYVIPDHIQALQTKSCSFHSQAYSEFGAQSYQKSLSVDVSVEGGGSYGLWSARFSASVGYKRVDHGTSQQRRVYVSARGKCIAYELAVNYATAPISVTDNFALDVKALPLQMNTNTYVAFLNQYGTHFTSRSTMGAKMIVRSEFTEQAYTKMQSTSVNVAVAAQASFGRMASGSVSAETQSQREQREAFESKRSSYSATYLGSHPPSDGKWETWAQSTEESCFPVVYKLVPITSLLEKKYFPDVHDAELTTRRNLLAGAYESYCSATAGCEVPGPDRVPMRTSNAITRIHGSARVSCIAGYKLLSCGLGNVQFSGGFRGYDMMRHAIPVSSTECECSDKDGANCIPWCTNVPVYFAIRESGVGGAVEVYCPDGYKVLGCAARHNGAEKWPHWHPHGDGRGCSCYNYLGVKCYASCASNVRNHEVRHQYGTGIVKVTCSPGNYVLGCGMKPMFYDGKEDFEHWRSWEVIGDNQCQCYDYFGATCFAACGQLT